MCEILIGMNEVAVACILFNAVQQSQRWPSGFQFQFYLNANTRLRNSVLIPHHSIDPERQKKQKRSEYEEKMCAQYFCFCVWRGSTMVRVRL